MQEPFLVLRNITKRFPGVLALNHIDLEVYAGQVHTLLGENGAGKSTLIKILTGAYTRDEGQILCEGHEVRINHPHDALRLGIAAIYQELNLVPKMSVAENIFLGREICCSERWGGLNHRVMQWQAAEVLADLGVTIDVRQNVDTLGMGYRQMVEIARALSVSARLIIMDEPTSSLSGREVERLLATIRLLRAKGVAILFISHRLDEVLEISDQITVLRDGGKVATVTASQTDREKLIQLMVGRALADQFPKVPAQRGEEALRVEGLTRHGVLQDISFNICRGEVLGIAGLVGAGRTELMRAVFGADPVDSGKIYVFGQEAQIASPQDAIRHGLAFLTEDRKGQGLVLMHDTTFNIALAGLPQFCRAGMINSGAICFKAGELVRDLKIRPGNIKIITRLLSGGNQQKVVIAKWLCSQAKIFIFDEPTRGIDVGAKVEVYHLINRLAAQGAAVIVVSSEMPEILGISDSILVMHEGKITGRFTRAEATQEKIMEAATGGVV